MNLLPTLSESESAFPGDVLSLTQRDVAELFLDVKKSLDSAKRGAKVLPEHAARIDEPYFRHLLELIGAPDISEGAVRRLAQAKKRVLTEEYSRRFALMRVGLLAMFSGENARKTLHRLNCVYPKAVLGEREAMDAAMALVSQLKTKTVDSDDFPAVEHTVAPDILALRILFYIVLARREGRQSVEPFRQKDHSPAFALGLSMILDGYDEDYVADMVDKHIIQLTASMETLMDLGLEMALGVKHRLSGEEMLIIARSFEAGI